MLNRLNYLVANWKMSLSPNQSLNFIKKFNEYSFNADNTKIILAPTFVSLPLVDQWIKNNNLPISLCAQNCASSITGALTGEVSVFMLKESGCQYVIVGHSERRNLFQEREPELSAKVNLAIQADLTPILCIGEPRDVYESGDTERYLADQLSQYSPDLPIIIAYEPIWSIGTGLIPTDESLHKSIQAILSLFPDTPLLYGGSVNPENIESLLQHKELSGFLVGGASTKPETLYSIYQSIDQYW